MGLESQDNSHSFSRPPKRKNPPEDRMTPSKKRTSTTGNEAMIRAGSRALQNSLSIVKPLAKHPLAQSQLRGVSQAWRKNRPELATAVPQDGQSGETPQQLSRGNRRSFEKGAPVKEKSRAKKPLHLRGRGSTREPRGRKQPHQQRQPLPTLSQNTPLHTPFTLRQMFEIPTAAQYGLQSEPVKTAEKLLAGIDGVISKNFGKASPKFRNTVDTVCSMNVVFDDGVNIRALGHGVGPQEAAHAAALHAICQLHKQDGLLREILPGGMYRRYTTASLDKLRQEVDVRTDVIDYAAHHDCLPVFSVTRLTRKGTKKQIIVHASIPELDLNGYGKSSTPESAMLHACIGLKQAAERHHEGNGGGMLLVKDYTKLNTTSAAKFVKFYSSEQGARWEITEATVAVAATGGRFVSTVSLSSSPISNAKSITDSNAWPGPGYFETSADVVSDRTFEGPAMTKKADAEAAAFVTAALTLKKESPSLWKTFTKEIRRGNGDILVALPPLEVAVDSRAVEIMNGTIDQVSIAERRKNIVNSTDSAEQVHQRPIISRTLSPSQIKAKNQLLLTKLAQYEKDVSLEQLRRKRSELPMVQHRAQVMDIVNKNDICVVVGATGSGKTTQLPQLILEESIRAGNGATCNIICTQPRRIAAISVAERVAVERDEPLRQAVGYSVRFDAKPPQPGGSVHYCTTGILLKQLQEDQDTTLGGISHIVIDEVHERDLQIDFLLVVLKQLMAERKAAGKPTIKIILMSATIDTTLFCKYFGAGFEGNRCPYIEVPGRAFPVTSHYLDEIHQELQSTYSRNQAPELYSRDTQKYIDRELINPPKLKLPALVATDNEVDEGDVVKAAIDWKSKGLIGEDGELDLAFDREDSLIPIGLMSVIIAHLLKTTTEGSILVFLPGLAEITSLNKLLMDTSPLGVDFGPQSDFKLYMLHSSLPQMQQEVFEKLSSGKRKIILSTNIAETSITIPDVVYVVDSSKLRETQYDRARSISSLVSAWTAKSNAKQRAGRAGRVQNGHYYTIASQARYESFEQQPIPEMLRSDLKELVLQTASMGIDNIWGFLSKSIQPPSQGTIETSIDELQSLRALDDDEKLTPLGRLLSTLPLSPSLGKMVVLAAVFKCLDPILILAAASTLKDPFLAPMDKRDEAKSIRTQWAKGTGSDQIAVINAFDEWRRLKSRGNGTEKQFAFNNFLHHNSLISISKTADQIMETLQKSGIVDATRRDPRSPRYGSPAENTNSESLALQTALTTAGFYPNVAVQSRRPGFLRTLHENDATIHVNSIAAPRTASGKRYGRLDPRDVAPFGTLFTFSQKTQADGQGISLRGVSKSSPLAVILFGGRSSTSPRSAVLRVDDWIPFYVKAQAMYPIQKLSNLMESYLERTFASLGTKSRNHILGNSMYTESFLSKDRAREPLIEGIVKALEAADSRADTLPMRERVYGDGMRETSRRSYPHRPTTNFGTNHYPSDRSGNDFLSAFQSLVGSTKHWPEIQSELPSAKNRETNSYRSNYR